MTFILHVDKQKMLLMDIIKFCVSVVSILLLLLLLLLLLYSLER